MTKKNKRKTNSELLEKQYNVKHSKKINPFELKINKEKHQVLGRRQKKLIGLPTVAHRKSLLKRKNTILQEYVHRNKKNVFSDKRLHIEKRKAAQAKHQSLKESEKYQLGEDVELTHLGQSLSKIKKMEEPFSDSDDEQLPCSFVESAHFGGFLIEKKMEEPVKSHQELIKEIIAESKKRKYEKQSEREAGIEMTEKLDSEWKEIQHLVSKGIQKKVEENKNISSYDMIVKQLILEKRGGASNPTKRHEEMEKQEDERKRKLEMDRKGRMNMVFGDQSENLSQQSDGSVNVLSTIPFLFDEMNKENGSDGVLGMPNESKVENETATLEKFIEITSSHSKDELNSFINQVIINNRSKLDHLGAFFNIMVEYACYIADDENCDVTILNVLIPHLYELAEMSAKVAAQYLLHILKKEEEHFDDVCKNGKHKKLQFPKLSTLIVLKLCCILFPTSDFRHLVASPAMLFIARLLVECHVFNVRDILCGLFLSSLALECVLYSKRYFPEAVNFLMRLLSLAVHEDDLALSCCPPFDNSKLDINILETNVPSIINKLKLSDFRNSNQELDNTSKLQLINFTTELLLKFMALYKELPSYTEIFSSLLNISKNLCNKSYPELIINKINKIIASVGSAGTKKYLSLPERPFTCLRFLEPKIEENFDGQKVYKGNKQYLEKEKLRHKFKREMKGAIREIRHDNYFLADHWLKEQAEKDRERTDKVKRLYQELANQEGNIKALKRKKF